jgi:hypothetical protein
VAADKGPRLWHASVSHRLANIVSTSIIADDRGDVRNEPYTRVQFAIAVLEMTRIDGVCGKRNDLCVDKVEGRRYFERYP